MLARTLLFACGVACGLAVLAATPASARTVCYPNGYCFNTSGRPIYDYGGHGYGYRPGWRFWRHHHHHHYWGGY